MSIVVGYCEDTIGEGIVGTIEKGVNVKRGGRGKEFDARANCTLGWVNSKIENRWFVADANRILGRYS
jgi:hypothetical protein